MEGSVGLLPGRPLAWITDTPSCASRQAGIPTPPARPEPSAAALLSESWQLQDTLGLLDSFLDLTAL